jgi:hypothetical protein
MSNIIKYSLQDPDVNIMIIENGYIHNNTLSVNESVYNSIFMPSMYVSWSNTQTNHMSFKIENTDDISANDEILYIFDTWGTSSYYHLVIDHVIPVWITTHFIKEFLSKQNIHIEKSTYLRVSNYNYPNELSNCNAIFKHFLHNEFTSQITGKYKYIVYGYCYKYRPYHGGQFVYYPKYQSVFDTFIHQLQLTRSTEKYILFAERHTRVYNKMDDLYTYLATKYTVKKVDFGKYTIEEQIALCSNAYALIGGEGASFANQIFMERGSVLISIYKDGEQDGNKFHSSIAAYMNHKYTVITCKNTTPVETVIKQVEEILHHL